MKTSQVKIRGIESLVAFAPVAWAALIVFTLSFGSVARADAIDLLRNTTDNTTIFHDDFENQAVVPFPTVSGLPSSALVGTWSAGTDFGGRLNYSEGVVDTANSIGGIAAQEGDQFLQISTTLASQGTAMTGVGLSANSGSGDTIESNIAFYMATGSIAANFYLYAGSDLLAAFLLNGDGNANTDFSLSAFDSTGAPGDGGFQQQSLTFSPDAWNTLKVVHVNGTSDWTVSFNGGSSATVGGYQDASAFLVDSIYLNQASPSTVYFDAVTAVPEPSSILLTGLGVLVIMTARRNRRD